MKKPHLSSAIESFVARALVAALALCLSAAACAAQKKNKKDNSSDSTNSSTPASPVPAGSDSEQIDNAIGEVLAGFQIGNIDLMHKHYADNATFVSGAYEPPVMGWQNYVPIYQRQRESFEGIQLLRRNTFIFTHADVAWATYEWEFDAMFNDRPYMARGQTTLVFNKVGGNWMIVHNHTSEICPENAPASAPQTPPKP